MLRVLGRLKEEGDILPTSSLPTLISDISVRKEQQGQDCNILACDFGIGDVKEESSKMTEASHDRSVALSLLSIDSYWRYQLLVEYSKDLFSCRVLDDQLSDGRHTVVYGFIYFQSRDFLTRSSKLKEKLLDAAYQGFLSKPTGFIRAYRTILEGFIWEVFKEYIHHHMRRCMDYLGVVRET